RLGVMTSGGACGVTAGALRHARVYETLIAEELNAEPDGAVVVVADRLRASATAPQMDSRGVHTAPNAHSTREVRANDVITSELLTAAGGTASTKRRYPRITAPFAVAVGLVFALAAAAIAFYLRPNETPGL